MQMIIDMTFDPSYPSPPNTVDLLAIAIADNWILADVVADLITAGVPNTSPNVDADSFAYHAFAIHANGPGHDPVKKLTERQANILTVT